MIHRVRIVPPIPQMSIVIPNVKLSIHNTPPFWPVLLTADGLFIRLYLPCKTIMSREEIFYVIIRDGAQIVLQAEMD
jgi:hypothetical protein